jgi:hypothetical protein
VLADIRTMPRSRHNPQFNGSALRAGLRRRGLLYAPVAALGGLRRARKDSPNTGWRNASFRGYADYMLTEDFESGLSERRGLTAKGTVALMCAEAVPWGCHRSLVADVLTARGAHVEHIIGTSHPNPHRLTPFARVSRGRVTYPGEDVAGAQLIVRAPFSSRGDRARSATPANEPYRYLGTEPLPESINYSQWPVLVEVTNRGTSCVRQRRTKTRREQRCKRSELNFS